MIKLAQAQAELISSADCQLGTETLSLLDALGRVAALDVQSSLDIPPCDNSAMDGFAVKAGQYQVGDTLTVSQRIPAGHAPASLEPGSAARIFTGGMLPDGADAVVIQENCQYQADCVTLNTAAQVGDNIRPRAQDISRGAVVIKRGQRLTAVDLSLLASIGHTEVTVYQRLRVAIFSTGDELVEPGNTLAPGQIYNSNRTLLIALCQQLGFTALDCGIVTDTLAATKAALADAAERADLIISSGGVSVGEEDHVKPAVESLGSLAMWKVQMKPGKPVAFGDVAGTPLLGLPGNPVSSFVVFQLLGVPLARALQGQLESLPTAYMVTAGFAKKLSTREDYIRVRLVRDHTGTLVAERFANLSSGVMSSLSWADGLLRQEIDQTIEQGDQVAFLPLIDGML